MMMTAKTDALEAVRKARELLTAPAPWRGWELMELRAILDYAVECVERIEETKRPRRKEQKKQGNP